MAKVAKRRSRGRPGAKSGNGRSVVKLTLLLLLAIALFGAAIVGLMRVEPSRSPLVEPASGDAPPVDHIDRSSRDALREILREEDGG